MILLILLTPPPDSDPPKTPDNVALDDERLKDDVPKGLQKVELDLDDALFLEFEDEEPAPPPAEQQALVEETPPAPEPTKEKPAKKAIWKKIWFLAAIGALILLLGAGGTFYFLKMRHAPETENATSESNASTESVTTAHNASEATLGAETAKNQTKGPVLHAVPFEPFQVEYLSGDQVRLLTCKFTVHNATDIMQIEMQAKSVILRDAVFRYFKNTDLAFLDNPDNSEQLKKNLIAVLNQPMKSGKITEILLDEYVVQ